MAKARLRRKRECVGLHGGRHASHRQTWRRGSESNRRIEVLQTSALPLGYRALKEPRTLLKFFAPRKDDFHQRGFLSTSPFSACRRRTQ